MPLDWLKSLLSRKRHKDRPGIATASHGMCRLTPNPAPQPPQSPIDHSSLLDFLLTQVDSLRQRRIRPSRIRPTPELLEIRELLSATPVIIDNGDPGYYDVRTWTNDSSVGHGGDSATASSTTAGALASWTFSNLENGQYYLQATWTADWQNASNATFTARSEFGAAGRDFSVNQRSSPTPDDIVGSTPFKTLGVVTVRNGSLVVELTSTATTGHILADAVRLEPVLSTDNSVEVRTERLDAITKALYAFHEVYRHFPPVASPTIMDVNGKFPLSWRVHLLPFLGYDSLYRSFHLNEPWNSTHNLTLLNQMPDVFRSLDLAAGSGLTGFQRIDSPGGFHITGAGGPSLNEIDFDNSATSLLLLELAADKAVPWTAPDDTPYSPLNPLATISPTPTGFMLAAMADGKIQRLNRNISADDFHALVTWNGKEILSADRLEEIFLPSTLTPDQISQNNLRNIYLGMANFQDSFGSFPPGSFPQYQVYYDANQNPYLSWRVHILPYIGEAALYKKFRLNEPWDSPNNLPLADLMPEIFRSIGVSEGSSVTGYQILNGPGAYNTHANTYLNPYSAIVDSYTETLAVIELPASSAKTWTRPDGDIPYNSADPLAGIAPIPSDGLWSVMFDGSVRKISPQITAPNMAALASWVGHEVLAAPELTNIFVDYPAPESISTRRLKLQQLGLAFWNYYGTFNEFPVTAYSPNMDANGRAKLGWRVYLLPYLGYSNLYNQFHLDEAWDSPHNLTLLDKMPEIYRSRGIPVGSHLTGFQLLTGPDAYRYRVGEYGSAHGPSLYHLYDGVESTILTIETLPSQAVEWTRPDGDIPFDLAHPLDNIDLTGLENVPGDGLLALMVDGSVLTLQPAISVQDFAALATWRGEEIVDAVHKSRSFFTVGKTLFPAYDEYYDSYISLRKIGLAFHNFHDSYSQFPIPNDPRYFDAQGKPKLSWRVYLLPYLDEVNLYNQFHLDEAWDSPHNLPLLDKMPEIFLSRGLSAGTNLTGFHVVWSPEAYYSSPNNRPTFGRITDGENLTIGVIETPPELAVPWSKPEDFPFNPADPFASIRALVSDYIAVMMMSGSAQAISPNIAPADAAAMITWRGGDVSNYEYRSFATNYELRSLTPQIKLTDSATNRYRIETDIAQLGSTPLGTPLNTTFTIKNTGSQPLIISSIQLPAGFSLITPLNPIAPNASASLTIRLDASIGGNFGGLITLNTNIPDQPALKFTLNADVTSPLTLSLSNSSLNENLPAGTTIGTLSTTGATPGSTILYTLVTGKGSDDNALFTIDASGNLKPTISFNYESRTSYSIRVRTTQQGGPAHEKTFTISVLDLFDPPVAVDDSATTSEDTPRIIDVLANDTSTDTPHTELKILAGTLGYRDTNGLFHPGKTLHGGTISLRPDGRVNYTPAPNFNGQDSFEYTLSDGIVRIRSLGGEVRIETSIQNSHESAQVAMDAEGNYVVVWTSLYPDVGDIYAQRFDSSGNPIGAEFRVNQATEGSQNDAAVAMDAQGNFVVAWISESPLDGQDSVVAQWFNSAGVRIGSERVIDGPVYYANFVTVAMNRNGESVISWIRQDSSDSETDVFARTFTPNGSEIGDEFKVNSSLDGRKFYPRAALADDGSFVVIWETRTTLADPLQRIYNIFGQRFDSNGAKLGNQFQVNTTPDLRNSWPTVAMNASGDFVVTWSRKFSLSGEFNVVAQRFDSSGIPLGQEILVHSTFRGDQLWSQVAMHDDGSFVISWESEEAPNSNFYDVFARRFDATGNPLDGEFRVNTTIQGNQFGSDIAMDDHGNFITVWDGDDDLDDNFDIFMQRFETLSSLQIGNVSINVNSINDAPMLNDGGNPTLTTIPQGLPQSSNAGTLISDLITRMSPSGGITDADPASVQGIAINGMSGTGTGIWQYSLDGGTTWLSVAATSNTNARLLASDPLTRIRYIANTSFLGEAKISFVAWDRTTGVNGGTANVSSRGGSTAFSLAYEYASQHVVNTAPELDADGNPTLDPIPQNVANANNPGTLVASLISRMAPLGSITDPNPGALLGIAINGLATTNGTWQYTVNNGTNWTNIATTGNTNARLLFADANTRIRFIPNTGFLGEAKLAFVAWDRTTGANGGIANVNNRGGTTPYSLNYEYASVFVINSAPILTPTNASTLNSIPRNVPNANNPGTLISDLIARMGPSGGISDPNPSALQGIAINGLGGIANGTWQYTLNNGSTWSAIATTGNSNARLLAANPNTRIRFVPNTNFTGTVKLAFTAWDQTTGLNGGIANVSTRGNTTPFSLLYDYASLTITL